MKEVLVTIVSQKGACGHGHAAGQSWSCGGKTPGGICASAYGAMYPTIRALAAGGAFPWAAPDGSLEVACPDGDNPVIFRLKAV